MALGSLKCDKKIRILQNDKGNCMARLNESTYKDKISSLLESEAYEILRKDPASQIGRYGNFFSSTKPSTLWIMSRIVIVILIYHRHIPIDSIKLLGS
jgi:hypothetical protein